MAGLKLERRPAHDARVRGPLRAEVLGAILAGLLGGLAAWWTAAPDPAPPVEAPPIAAPSVAPAADVPSTARPQGAAPPPSLVSVSVQGLDRAKAEVALWQWTSLGQWEALARRTLGAEQQLELDVPPGRYRAEARAEGAFAEATVEAAPRHRHDVVLTLTRTRSVAIELRSRATGAPLRGEVERVDDPRGRRWPTDAFGRGQVDGLGPDEVWLRASAPGHLPQKLSAGPQQRELHLRLEPAAKLTGLVRDAAGPAVAGATVRATGGVQATTDAAGRYALEVPPGVVDVVALDPAGRSGRARATATLDHEVRGVDVLLEDPNRVEGVVVDENLQPVPSAQVRAEAPAGFVVARALSGPDGRFSLEGLPPGWVNVLAQQGRGARGERLRVDVNGAEPLVVRLEPGAALWGLVTDGAGGRVPGARVVLRSGREPNAPLETVTDVEGAFRVDELPPGFVVVTAVALGGATSQPQKLMLASGAALRQDLVLSAPGTIVGRVRGATEPRQVAAFRHLERRETLSDPSGAFRFELPPGDWVLSHGALGRAHFYGTRTVTVHAGERVEVELGAEDSHEGDSISATAPGTVGATLQRVNGRVAFAWIIQDGPAGRAGITEGDVLERVEGEAIASPEQAQALLKGAPGSTVRVETVRDGARRALSLERQRGL